jgi:hypothetical protein
MLGHIGGAQRVTACRRGDSAIEAARLTANLARKEQEMERARRRA